MKLFSWLFGSGDSKPKKTAQKTPAREWHSWKPQNPVKPPEEFVWIPEFREVNIAGTSHRTENCRTFLAALKGGRATEQSVVVEPDDGLPDHPNAFAVFATMAPGRTQIGYLPSDVSASLAAKYPRSMPLRAALREWGKKSDEEAYFFRVALFMPNAKGRKQYTSAGS